MFISDSFLSIQNRQKQKYTVAVQHDVHPDQIIREVIFKRIRNMDKHKSQEDKIKVVEETQSAYVLKVAGSDQFFLQACPVSQYKYIRSCIARDEIPQLMLIWKKGVHDNLYTFDFHVPAYMRRSAPPSYPAENASKLWHLEAPFKVKVSSATYVNVKEADMIYVRLGIFHGTDALCQVKQTKSVPHKSPRWDEWVSFDDLFTVDLPRAAKLCVSICAADRFRLLLREAR